MTDHPATPTRVAPPDDERIVAGMPVLDRQPVREPTLPPSLQGMPARSVPETRPTPLRDHYINLSVVALVCGAIAITLLEFGTPVASPVIKLLVLVGVPPLALAMGDATVRIWRSAWAWMPVNRGRALFRLAWVAVMLILWLLLAAATIIVLLA